MAQSPAKKAPQPQPVPQETKPIDVVDLVTNMQGWFKQLERSTAAFNSLQTSYLTFMNQLPEGHRPKGLPLFEFKASLATTEGLSCVLDLKKVKPSDVPNVLIPLINSQVSAMTDSVSELANIMQLLVPLLTSDNSQADAQTG